MRTMGCCLLGAMLSFFVGDAEAREFVQQARLTASDAAPGDDFGSSVAVSSDGMIVLVGAPHDDCSAGLDCGAAYVFFRSQGGWSQEAKLTVPEAGTLAGLGSQVALSGDGSTALLRARSEDCLDSASCAVAYVFRRTGGSWNGQGKLKTSGMYIFPAGRSMALSEDGRTALLGAPRSGDPQTHTYLGTAHVFVRNGESWSEETRLTGEQDFQFGNSVALSRDGLTALVGVFSSAPLGPPKDPRFVGAHVFVRGGGAWVRQQRLTGRSLSDFSEPAIFGEVTLSGDGNTAFLSNTNAFSCLPDVAPETSGNGFCGALLIFSRTGGAWVEQPYLSSPFGVFGFNSALSGDGSLALIGTLNPTVFERTGQTWNRGQQLQGYSLALSDPGLTAVTGNTQEDCSAGISCGAAYVYGAPAPTPEVPAVSPGGLGLLALLLAAGGARVLARRRSV